MAKNNWMPWVTLDEFKEQMDRLLDESIYGVCPTAGYNKGCVWVPAADVVETRESYSILIELPGLELKDVAIEMKNSDLWVFGKRPFSPDSDEKAYLVMERSYGSFARKFRVPMEIGRNEISANLKDGLLTIIIPKADSAPPSKLKIEIE